MGLKELTSNLENFKYNITSPDKLDGQIESGVDFFDDETGGATGFTPKVDLDMTVGYANTNIFSQNNLASGYNNSGVRHISFSF